MEWVVGIVVIVLVITFLYHNYLTWSHAKHESEVHTRILDDFEE